MVETGTINARTVSAVEQVKCARTVALEPRALVNIAGPENI
jgi:hypothetical protein